MSNFPSIARWLQAGLMILSIAQGAFAQTDSPDASDPYLWLEQVDGDRAMQWVRNENAKTLGVFEKDPRYATFYAQALALAEDKDRIPGPMILNGKILNFWQDSDHVRGILRRTSARSYDGASPRWKTVLDLDALSKSEKANWVWHGMVTAGTCRNA